jgi:hypothetical protein
LKKCGMSESLRAMHSSAKRRRVPCLLVRAGVDVASHARVAVVTG